MPFAQLNNVRIHYDFDGPANAPALIFSNSLGANLSMWDQQAFAFREHFRVLRYDTRGHGQSSTTPGPYNIEQLSRDVLALLASLQLDRVYFCGLSKGGMTGMWLGLHAPQVLHKLILCNTAAKIGNAEGWNSRIEAARKGGMKSISGAVMERWLTPAFRASSSEVTAATLRMLESTDLDGYIANCAAVRDFDARETISGIGVPTLVIAGAHDPATTPGEGRFLAEKIPGARYVELHAAHLSNIEARDGFNSELSTFLAA
jgi:3-oxoadipate enol-lactonase